MKNRSKATLYVLLMVIVVAGIGLIPAYRAIPARVEEVGQLQGNATVVPVVGETQANTHQLGDQRYPSVSALTADTFAVAWTGAGEGDSSGVYATVFNATTGENLTAEFRVNTYTTQTQAYPSVSALTADTFAVAWASYGQDYWYSYGVYAAVFDATTGENLTPEFLVNNYTVGGQLRPSVSALTADTFAVAWDGAGYGDGSGVFATVCNATTGTNLTPEFRVNTNTTNDQGGPSVSALTADTFAVAWVSWGQDGDRWGVYATVCNATTGENLTPEFRVNINTTSDQQYPSVSALTADTFAVAWMSTYQDGSGVGVYAAVFDATTGAELTPEFQMNTYTTGDQQYPSISALTTNTFAVAWHSQGQDGDGAGVYAAVFDATTGENLTAEFQVNTYTTWSQEYPSVSALAADTFVVAWDSYLQDGSQHGVFFNVFGLPPSADESIPGFTLFYVLGGLTVIATLYILYVRRRRDPPITGHP